MTIGLKIRGLRESEAMLQRELAAKLEISEAYLSKVENDQKPLKRTDLLKISEIFDADHKELEELWLASKIYETIKDEEYNLEALKIAEKQVKYNRKTKS